MFEDFENVNAKEALIIEADFWQDVEKDLEEPEVQKAWGLLPEQIEQSRLEQDLEFA